MENQLPARGTTPVGRRLWHTFFLNGSLILLLFVVGVFLAMSITGRDLIERSMSTNARAYFQSIVITRDWNANYGGVYVEKRPGVRSNPYLKDPDVVLRDGRIFTERNPATMTREISELAERNGLFKFHITSLKPINPDNAPDEFERAALAAFERGVPEMETRETLGSRRMFRYMGPLVTDTTCLKCHADQGYRVGDIRGGISVRFDVTDVERQVDFYSTIVTAFGIIAFVALIIVLYLLVRTFRRRLSEMEERIAVMAVTDVLTGLPNRRAFFDRLPGEIERGRRYGRNLGVVMLDIDNFKAVNDRHGHACGDEVLKQFGALLAGHLRAGDIAGRYGGEEFVVLMPETAPDGVRTATENIRSLTEQLTIGCSDGASFSFTVSAGIDCLDAAELSVLVSPEQILQGADTALYRAKREGRNRVAVATKLDRRTGPGNKIV